METLNNPQSSISPVKNSLKWGLITGLVLIIFSLITYYGGMMANQALQWVSYLFLAIGIFLGVKKHRDDELGGYMTYGRGLGAGVLIGLFAGLLLAIYIYAFFSASPGALEELKRIQEEGMYEKGMPQEQIEMSLKFVSPGIMALFTLPAMTFFGFIFSLIISAILKKDRPAFIEEREDTPEV